MRSATPLLKLEYAVVVWMSTPLSRSVDLTREKLLSLSMRSAALGQSFQACRHTLKTELASLVSSTAPFTTLEKASTATKANGPDGVNTPKSKHTRLPNLSAPEPQDAPGFRSTCLPTTHVSHFSTK